MTRFAILLTGYCAVAAVVIPAFVRPAPRLVWNASASVPVGLYAARPGAAVHAGDLVAAHAPAPVARLMAARGYLPLRLPMLKHVAATSGQTICRSGRDISIDGRHVAAARERDRAGRPLPVWSGCRTLRAGEIFLLNPASADSFDGRYFGAVPARTVVAVLTPLWLPGGDSAAPGVPEPASHPTTEGPSR